LIRLTNHLINLLIRELLTDRGHHVAKLGSGDETVVVAIEDLKRA
jgi:hypothetical protein